MWCIAGGEQWPLGRLADDGRTLLFEYAPEALAQGLELSPLHLKLRPQAYGDFPVYQHRLPGLLADSLPDGWGLLLMDRVFRQQWAAPPWPAGSTGVHWPPGHGRWQVLSRPKTPMPKRRIGGLLALAQESARVLAGEAGAALRELAFDWGLATRRAAQGAGAI